MGCYQVDHWSLLNKARAIENQCYLISCNCAGIHGGVTFGGRSMVVDPWGVAVASGGDRETVVWASIDLEEVEKPQRLSGACGPGSLTRITSRLTFGAAVVLYM